MQDDCSILVARKQKEPGLKSDSSKRAEVTLNKNDSRGQGVPINFTFILKKWSLFCDILTFL